MNDRQFTWMAERLHARGTSRQGCKLVLVDGLRICDAARVLEVDPVLISVSIRAYRVMYREIQEIFVNHQESGHATQDRKKQGHH